MVSPFAAIQEAASAITCRSTFALDYALPAIEADLRRVVEWAKGEGRQWAFSLSNAGARYAEFRKDLADLGEIDWPSIGATDFRSERVKEGKQAEFLVHGFFPWKLIERIGTLNETRGSVLSALRRSEHRPPVEIRREWYY